LETAAPAPAAQTPAAAAPLLDFVDFKLHFDTFDGVYQALDGVTLAVAPGESVGIVGETGCGKSITAKSVLGLVPTPPARVAGGDVRFAGRSVLTLTPAEMRRLRGNEIAMIFQDPMTYLNPLFTVGQQMGSVLAAHDANAGGDARRRSRAERRARAVDLFRRVHLPNPETLVDRYPHQLSGGQRQRVAIARALILEPSVLLLDEPTSALDVSVQAEILNLLARLRTERGFTYIMVTHDLAVVDHMCDQFAVMLNGEITEVLPRTAIVGNQATHPYARQLIGASLEYEGHH
jgi:ABC-type dipeptide/oligopeptide/nickel transport system ATPase component